MMKFDYGFFWRLSNELDSGQIIAVMVLYRAVRDEGLSPTPSQWARLLNDTLKGKLKVVGYTPCVTSYITHTKRSVSC